MSKKTMVGQHDDTRKLERDGNQTSNLGFTYHSSLCQLVFQGTVHAVAVRGDLPDL